MDFAVNLTIEAADGLAGADFDERFSAELLHGVRAVDPQDRAGRLSDQCFLDVGSLCLHLSVHIG